MKALTFICGFIILSFFLAGCGNDQYSLEREFWKTQKQAEKIFANPHASPPAEVNNVLKSLKQFSRAHPDSTMAVEAEFIIARIYIIKTQYENARAQLQEMRKTFSTSDPVCAEAMFLSGNTYQLEDKWPQALEEYKKIIQKYPFTVRGVTMPVYIAEYYKVKFQPDKMRAAYQEAIDHYRGLAKAYTFSPLGIKAYSLISECYGAVNDWQNVIDTYKTILTVYKGKAAMDNVLFDMAYVYKKQLNDNAKAKETLQELMKDYPKSKFGQNAKKLLKELEK